MKTIILFLFLIISVYPQGENVLLLVGSGNVSYSGATPLFTFDFESSSGWTGDGTQGSRSTTVAHTGTYSWAVTGVGDDYATAYKTLSAMDSAYVTFYIYVPSTTTVTAGGYSYMAGFDIGTTATDGDRSIFGGNYSGTLPQPWIEWVFGINSGDMNTSNTNFATNAWRKVKAFYKKGTGTNAISRFWIDNGSGTYTQVLDKTNGTYTDAIQSFSIGIRAATLSGNIYFDDVKIYDTNPD